MGMRKQLNGLPPKRPQAKARIPKKPNTLKLGGTGSWSLTSWPEISHGARKLDQTFGYKKKSESPNCLVGS